MKECLQITDERGFNLKLFKWYQIYTYIDRKWWCLIGMEVAYFIILHCSSFIWNSFVACARSASLYGLTFLLSSRLNCLDACGTCVRPVVSRCRSRLDRFCKNDRSSSDWQNFRWWAFEQTLSPIWILKKAISPNKSHNDILRRGTNQFLSTLFRFPSNFLTNSELFLSWPLRYGNGN